MATIPNSNVNLATHIRDVLNNAGGSVTDDCTTFFSEGANINIWNRYKPVRHTKKFGLTLEDFQSANFGLEIPTVDPLNVLPSLTAEIKYLPPRGGESEPLRIGDFRGYNSLAKSQYNITMPTTIYTQGTRENVVKFTEVDGQYWSLFLTDIYRTATGTVDKPMYLALCVWDTRYTTGTGLKFYIDTVPIQNGGTHIIPFGFSITSGYYGNVCVCVTDYYTGRESDTDLSAIRNAGCNVWVYPQDANRVKNDFYVSNTHNPDLKPASRPYFGVVQGNGGSDITSVTYNTTAGWAYIQNIDSQEATHIFKTDYIGFAYRLTYEDGYAYDSGILTGGSFSISGGTAASGGGITLKPGDTLRLEFNVRNPAARTYNFTGDFFIYYNQNEAAFEKDWRTVGGFHIAVTDY